MPQQPLPSSQALFLVIFSNSVEAEKLYKVRKFKDFYISFLCSPTTVSICASLSKLKLISSAMIGILNLMDLSHWPLGCRFLIDLDFGK